VNDSAVASTSQGVVSDADTGMDINADTHVYGAAAHDCDVVRSEAPIGSALTTERTKK